MVLCAGAFGCYAAQGSLPGAQGQGYDLNLSYSRTTLKAVADAITQQVGIAFSYETALAGYPMENLEVSEKGATIEAILAAVFTPRGIDYRVVDKVVVLTRSTRPVPAASAAAKSEVKGVVRDAAGNPMIGVTVTIKGTLVGVSTGVDGGYAIPADGNATLLFSYIGYRPHEEVVGRRTQIDVTMQEDELVMDEVVVVGYGTLKKRNIVGAVENLSGDAVENRPNANITRSLQGQIPGLNIVQVDGKADHAGEVTIRGVNNTFKARVSGGEKTNKLGQGGGALVLIDGAEGDMGSVNPDDIASISVLKDASSAAVYGARGAFGVILITTKDPEKGKVRVSYNGSVSLHRRTVIWEDNVVTDPVQWVDAFRESYLNSSPTATVPSLFNNYMPYSNAWFEELKRRRADPTMDNYDIDANGNYNYYGETNWLKEIYKSVNYSTTHAVSIQGGREGVSYYISGRYYNQDGIYKVGEETYKKYNLRAKGSIRIRPWLTLDNNTSLMSSKYHQPMVHYGQQVISRQIDMFAFPFALLKNPDGTWTQTAAKTGYAAFAEGTSWQENNKLEVANTTTFNFEFVPDVFKVSADVTYKGSRWSRDRMENLYTYYTGVNVSGQDNSFSSLENWTYRSDYISTNIVGTVTPKLGADHDLNVVAGWNLEDYDYRTQKTYRQGNLYPSKPSFTLMDGEYYSTTSGGYTWGLSGFSEAHIMIGHTHYHQKYIHKRNGKTILEHVHGAACGAWWTANICADGTPNGYSVYEISGNTIANQYYKSTNKEAGYQIRAYSATQVFGKSGSLTFGWAANAPAMNDAKCIVANVWNSDASGNWKVSLWQNGTKVCDMTRVKTYDYWAYAYHVLYYSKSVGTTWGKNLDHYYYGNLASGTPETADFEIVAEDGMGNTYRTSKLQTDFIGF